VTPAEPLAAVMLLALIAYVLLGGADFGGGVWDLLATGPRAGAQRKLIEQALASRTEPMPFATAVDQTLHGVRAARGR